MRKHRTKSTPREVEIPSGRQGSSNPSALREALLAGHLALREVMVKVGLETFALMLEEDREELCGVKNRFAPDRTAYRYGYDEGTVVLGGRKVRLDKPRARSVDGHEMELPCWGSVKKEDPLEERVLEQMLVGISSRQYGRSLESLGEKMKSVTTSRSSVSRRLVARTGRQVEEFLSRPLGKIDLAVLLLDGTWFGEHMLVTALGIDTEGRKHVLGVVEGTTENEEVCRDLFRSLIDRGLKVDRARLFVIDGGKGIRRAIRTVFGDWALVQRCQIHKLRNVAGYLPKRMQGWVKAAMRKAWAMETVAGAKGKLLDLASQLEGEHPDAAGSIKEGLEQTLTITALGVGGWLKKSLYSTNTIENLQGALKRVTRNVKRWRGGSMVQRWAVAALAEAQKRFRRVRGHREIPQLLAALEAHVSASTLSGKARAS